MASSGTDRSVRAAYTRLRQAQKSGEGVPAYTRWVNRGLAKFVAAVAFRVGLTPNAVSVLSLMLSAAALALLMVAPAHHAGAGVGAAALLALGFVLDSADGQLARLAGIASPAGEWLDHLFDAIRGPAVHLTVVVVFLTSDEAAGWVVPVAFAFALLQVGQFSSQMLGGMLLDRTDGPRTPPRRFQSWILLPTDTGVICWIFVLWGWPQLFGTGYAVVFALTLLHALVSMRRRFRELSQARR